MNAEPNGTPTRIAVVSGGVGAARFLSGLIDAIDDLDDVGSAAAITAVVNTGDDCTLHGLSISPDLDTVTYTLAGAIDPERGWGLIGESWRAMESLERYESVRPAGSSAAPRPGSTSATATSRPTSSARLASPRVRRSPRSPTRSAGHGRYRFASFRCRTTG